MSAAAAVIAEEPKLKYDHNISSYRVKVAGLKRSIDLPFFPGVPLSLEGPSYTPNETRVFLFHVMSNVYLVLKGKWFFELPCPRRAFHRDVTHPDTLLKLGIEVSRVHGGPWRRNTRSATLNRLLLETGVGVDPHSKQSNAKGLQERQDEMDLARQRGKSIAQDRRRNQSCSRKYKATPRAPR
jgi:hypothetical protein